MSSEPPRAEPRLLLACALGVESLALRGGLRGAHGVRLIRTGMGKARASRAVGAALAQEERAPGALLFAGFGAAVGPGIRPGDAIVATEVRDADSGPTDPGATDPGPTHAGPTPAGPTQLPDTAALVTALRRSGLTVHTGPLFTADAVVRGDRRGELHAAGVVGVDMETAAALRALPAGTPAAAVRIVVDTPEQELLRPATLVNGLRAWRALRTAAPVLAAWQPPRPRGNAASLPQHPAHQEGTVESHD